MAVARGERSAPADAAKRSFKSVEALVRLLTPENRQLLALIRDSKPNFVAELVQITGPAQPEPHAHPSEEGCRFHYGENVGRRKGSSTAIKQIVV